MNILPISRKYKETLQRRISNNRRTTKATRYRERGNTMLIEGMDELQEKCDYLAERNGQ